MQDGFGPAGTPGTRYARTPSRASSLDRFLSRWPVRPADSGNSMFLPLNAAPTALIRSAFFEGILREARLPGWFHPLNIFAGYSLSV